MDEPVGAPELADDAPLRSVLTQLYDDGRAYASAQIDLLTVVGKEKARALGWLVVLVLTALVLAFGALLALLVGLMLVLQPMLGTGWAVMAVVIGAVAVAGLIGWLGYARMKRLFER
jgi:Putative Actinobacterial Holin-X, holin superfamily III